MARERDEYEDDARSRRHRDDYDEEDDYYYDDRPRGGPPSNYLVPAILTTLFCCTPFGIVALVYAAQVHSKWYAGDRRGALAAAANAKLWCWLSFGSIAVIMVLYIAGAVLAGR
jgi:hypothetical protein